MKPVCCLVVATLVVSNAVHITAQPQQGRVAPSTSTRAAAPRVLPGSRANLFGTIQGNALSSTNTQLPNVVVRLRDIRFGAILDTQITDTSGLFTFRDLDPGSYVVEMMGDEYTVLAASKVLPINAGESATTIVKLPIRISRFAGLLGHSTASAAVVAAQAAASGVLAVRIAGEEQCKKPKG